MPAYHSKIDGAGADEACGCALLPLKTKLRGPAPAAPPEGDDIIDETIKYFRPNCLFRNFDVSKSGKLTVDELLEGLKGLGAAFENMTKPEVEKVVIDAFGKDPEGATVSYADFVGFVARARGQLDAAEA